MQHRYLTRFAVPAFAALAVAGLSVSAFGQSSTIIVAPSAPPPPHFETVPPPPVQAPVQSQVMVWTPGHWAWNGANWAWIDGQYVERPQPTAAWEPGHWEQQPTGGYVWVDGHWRS